MSAFSISKFNTRALANLSKKIRLAYYANKYNIDVLYLQEHNEHLQKKNILRDTHSSQVQQAGIQPI